MNREQEIWENLVQIKKEVYCDKETFKPYIRYTLDVSVEGIQDLKAYGYSENAFLEYIKTVLQGCFIKEN